MKDLLHNLKYNIAINDGCGYDIHLPPHSHYDKRIFTSDLHIMITNYFLWKD